MRNLIARILALIIFLPIFVVAQTEDSVQARRHSQFDPKRDAEKDLEKAIIQAKQENKLILLDVGGEWCIWCHRLDSLFLINKDLDDYLHAHYVVVKVNVSEENRNGIFLSKYPKIAGYPHLFVLNAKGKLLESKDTGEFEYPKGYRIKGHNKAKVYAFLRKWTK